MSTEREMTNDEYEEVAERSKDILNALLIDWRDDRTSCEDHAHEDAMSEFLNNEDYDWIAAVEISDAIHDGFSRVPYDHCLKSL